MRDVRHALERARRTAIPAGISGAVGLMSSVPVLSVFLVDLFDDKAPAGALGAAIAVAYIFAFALLIAGGTLCIVASLRIPAPAGSGSGTRMYSGLRLALWGTGMLSVVAIVPVIAAVSAVTTGLHGSPGGIERLGYVGICGPIFAIPVYTLVTCWLARARLRPVLEVIAEAESARRDLPA